MPGVGGRFVGVGGFSPWTSFTCKKLFCGVDRRKLLHCAAVKQTPSRHLNGEQKLPKEAVRLTLQNEKQW